MMMLWHIYIGKIYTCPLNKVVHLT